MLLVRTVLLLLIRGKLAIRLRRRETMLLLRLSVSKLPLRVRLVSVLLLLLLLVLLERLPAGQLLLLRRRLEAEWVLLRELPGLAGRRCVPLRTLASSSEGVLE